MESHDILFKAETIAHAARASAEHKALEETVKRFERSPLPVLRSLARTYRMLQFPFK